MNNTQAIPFERTNPIPVEEDCVICSQTFLPGERVTHHTGGIQHPFHMDCIRRIRDAN
jgi:hypothetical protein